MRPTTQAEAPSSLIPFKHFFAVGLISLLGYAHTASAATIAVSNEAELRAAIVTATSNGVDDTIDLGGNTIVLENGELTVSFPSSGSLIFDNGTIDGGNATRIFSISNASTNTGTNRVIFDFLTLRNGSYTTADGSAAEAGGAAIFSNGVNISVADSLLEDNAITGAGTGGAVLVRSAEIEVIRSEFRNNRANGGNGLTSGGAISTNNSDFINIEDSLFVNNFATRGGAIAPINHTGVTFVDSSTFISNQATGVGGAIWNRNNISVETSTFFQNRAGTGGGALYLQPQGSSETAFVRRSTFVDNTSGTRANTIFLANLNPLPVVQGNIFIDNDNGIGLANQNCGNINGANPVTLGDDGFNFSDDSSCGTASLTGDTSAFFITGSPADNGGSTPTFALSRDSLAVDRGIPLGSTLCTSLDTDQRGEQAVNDCDAGSYELQPDLTDGDNDTIIDTVDNCPMTPNADQANFNDTFAGDACEDSDQDGELDANDNCPAIPNPDQLNSEGDRQGDACDTDDDNDGVDDVDDAFPIDSSESTDNDTDGVGDNADLDDDNDEQLDADELECGSDPLDGTSLSDDADGDNIPDCVDDDFALDADGDGVPDAEDNCPADANTNQSDFDRDTQGDVCDLDDDDDGVPDVDDDLPRNADETVDTDNDGIGNNADRDDDNDRQTDADELECGSLPLDETSLSADADGDNIPDCVDDDFVVDTDGDGVADANDNCPAVANTNQLDFDRDSQGNACDLDDDNDGVEDANDAFPLNASESVDTDNDGVGNNADLDDDNDGQSDVHEAACGSNPLVASSTSADADGDGIPDCVDDDVVGETQPVTVYQNINFTGNSLSVGLGDVSIGDLRNSDVGNDQISSIMIAPGFQVLACSNSRFGGRCETFTNDTSNLRSVGFNDVISSLRVSEASPVTVFEHVNFRGRSLGIQVGDTTIGDLRRSSVGNDRISSIQIAPGFQVLACSNSRLRGRCETFTNDTPDLRRINLNDVISSLQVSEASPVTVYEHVNFRGRSLGVEVGDTTINDLRSSVGNDRISSIQIAPGFEVFACLNSRFNGRCETFTNDTPDLRRINFNDVISSLRVTSTGQ